MYNTQTKQGWDIVSKFQNNKGTFVVVKRSNDYAWGSYYNEETGSWAQGHYDYRSPLQAEEDMIKYALGVNIIEAEDYSFKEALRDFAFDLAKEDKKEERAPADYEEFMEEFHRLYEDELNEMWNIYKLEMHI